MMFRKSELLKPLQDFEQKTETLMQEMQGEIFDKIVKNFDELLIEGLRLKGFDFENKSDLEQFVKDRCKCEDDMFNHERVYFVDNTPFFLHEYPGIFDIKISELVVNVNYGKFRYL